MNDRFNRQLQITGWDQMAIAQARIAVIGNGACACFAAAGFGSLGIGEIVLIGKPSARTQKLAEHITRQEAFSDSQIAVYPFDVEYGRPELECVLEGLPLNAIVCCSGNSHAQRETFAYAKARSVPFFAGVAAGGGWCGRQVPPQSGDNRQHVMVAMAVAALLIEAVREHLFRLTSLPLSTSVPLNLTSTAPSRSARFLLVGVGGIGVYAAMLLAMAGYETHLVDFDRVEASNLNRQGLYSSSHARWQAPKASAAAEVLRELFPNSHTESSVLRADERFGDVIDEVKPTAILSAVDNARTRLLLSRLGIGKGIPVVQAGTDVFSADCFTQETRGWPLDEQMHGMLSTMAEEEHGSPRTGHCGGDPSYVVPGMVAGAVMALRAMHVAELYQGLAPICWRAGHAPQERRNEHREFDFSRIVL